MLIVVLVCFVGGAVARRWLDDPAAISRPLDRFVIGVALPALILAKVPAIPLDADAVVPAVVAWGAVAVAAAAVLVASRVAGWDRRVTGTLLLVTPLGNTSFLGIAVVEALLGTDHVASAITYDQLGSFLALVTYGSVVAARYGTGEGGWRPVARRVLTFPPFIALLVSVVLRFVHLPDPVVDGLAGVGRLLAPAAMLALGLRFRLKVQRRVLGPAVFCLSTRMLLLPLVALAVAALVDGLDDVVWEASVLEAGMPPMVTAAVVAASADLDEELATMVVGAGIAVAAVTLPLLALVVG